MFLKERRYAILKKSTQLTSLVVGGGDRGAGKPMAILVTRVMIANTSVGFGIVKHTSLNLYFSVIPDIR